LKGLLPCVLDDILNERVGIIFGNGLMLREVILNDRVDILALFKPVFENLRELFEVRLLSLIFKVHNHVLVDSLREQPSLFLEVLIKIFADSIFGLYSQQVFFSPRDKFFPCKSDFVDVELISLKEF
jgi:hypothetical protein